jgi:hypothetical protein
MTSPTLSPARTSSPRLRSSKKLRERQLKKDLERPERGLSAMTAYRMYIDMEDFMNAMAVTVSNRGGSCMQIPDWRYVSGQISMKIF